MSDTFEARKAVRRRRHLAHHLLIRLEALLRERQQEILQELRTLSPSSGSTTPKATEAGHKLRAAIEATKNRLESDAASVMAALERIKTRRYGVCACCGEAIDRHRLAMLPDAELCTSCQWQAESVRQYKPGVTRKRHPSSARR